MMTMAVGYRTRAYVTFGEPISLDTYHAESRKDVVELAHRIKEDIGRLYKVVPSALVARAMRSSMTAADLESRISPMLAHLEATGANIALHDPRRVVAEGTGALLKRGIMHKEGPTLRVRERSVLRYYARTIQHLFPAPAPAGAATPDRN